MYVYIILYIYKLVYKQYYRCKKFGKIHIPYIIIHNNLYYIFIL